ncbi:alpha/beta hydrolase family protein [Aliikangiella coralliicola]|uniref:S9 family peptidase n=1 Tax=Aliikangiella coralliicola TaxID=2592383 RepID=A0A545UG50_9GAMM|nr:prolyl oligopeptidase family serine peptidase [Aliikangiella coralliicola]TQV88415.1 S9 family peptidase [Aliikangiella coralliicola]
MVRCLLAVVFIMLSGSVFAKPIPLSYFAKDAEFDSIKLSPDGKHFAAAAPYRDQTVLVVIDRESMKPVNFFRFKKNEHVDDYYWANNERLVFTRVIKRGWAEQPSSYGQIFAGNFDGSKKAIIFGYQAGTGKASRVSRRKGAVRAFGEILHMLPDDPEHIIISSQHMDNDQDASKRIVKLNIYTSRRHLITRTPFGNMRVILNAEGVPVTANGHDKDGRERLFFFRDGNWDEVSQDEELNNYNPVSVSKDGRKLYLSSYLNGKTEALFEYDFKTKAIDKIFHHETADVFSLIREPENNSVVGVEVMPGHVEYHYLDRTNAFAKTHAKLVKSFAGKSIKITSRTRDQSEMIVFANSDKDPGNYFIFNNEKKSATYLIGTKSWIDPAVMAERKPIQFKSRDGKTIYGYLTLPINLSKKAPLVTFVHGGPYGVQDRWWFDTTPQMLANNGYAVLQVNYRGSGGYGKDYEEIAYRKRSSLIQQDIIDGTKWAQSLPQIQDNKACIMGWSFGGYSALMSPLIEPELFSCSVAAAGVYDAIEQEEEADYSEVDSVAAQAAKVYGSDEQLLKKESPLTYIDNLKIPVFIVHGGEDKRVPPEQAYLLKEAMDERKMPYEWMFKEKEGHGFYNEKNREEFYQRTLAFLDKYLR